MLVPDFQPLPQKTCDALFLVDTTCSQSTSCPGGYGGSNIAKTDVKRIKVTLDFGGTGIYTVTKPWDSADTFVIVSDELAGIQGNPCNTCQTQTVNHPSMLPSGCVTITYEPQYQNEEDEWVSAGRRTKRFILKCVEVYRLAAVAQRIYRRKMACQYDSTHSETDLKLAMLEAGFILQDLNQLEGEDLVCECVLGDLLMINARIKTLEAKW